MRVANKVIIGGDISPEIVVRTEVGEPDWGEPPVVVGVQLAEPDGRLVKVVVGIEPDGRISEGEGRRRLLPEGGGRAEGLDVRPTAEVKVAEAGGDLVEGGGREAGEATVPDPVLLDIVFMEVADVVVVSDVVVIIVTPLGIVVAAPFRVDRVILKEFCEKLHFIPCILSISLISCEDRRRK